MECGTGRGTWDAAAMFRGIAVQRQVVDDTVFMESGESASRGW